MNNFCPIPSHRIIFSNDGCTCYEQVISLSRPVYLEDPLPTVQYRPLMPHHPFELLNHLPLDCDKPRPIGSMLHAIIKTFDDGAYNPSHAMFDNPVHKNINALKWFLSTLDTDYRHSADNFVFFRDQVSRQFPGSCFPISDPYDTESNTMLPTSKEFSPKLSTEDGKKTFYAAAEFNDSFHKPSKDAPVKKPYTDLARCYTVNDLWDYCCATCEYIAQPYTPLVHLRKCVHCGKYYVASPTAKNSRTCSQKCSELHRKAYKQVFSEPQKLVKGILNMLGHRFDNISVEARLEFQENNQVHKDNVKQGYESIEEYTEWLEEMYDAYRINKSRKK